MEIETRYNCIYKITNTANGKSYIGQTINLPAQMRQYLNCKKMKGAIYNAIRKYGKEVFKLYILEYDIPYEMLDGKGIYYISLYNTTSPNGYNEAKKRRHTEESKRKMSEAKKGSKRPGNVARNKARIGYKHTEETKKKIGKSVKHYYWNKLKEKTGKKRPDIADLNRKRKGCRLSDETKRKISESLNRHYASNEKT